MHKNKGKIVGVTSVCLVNDSQQLAISHGLHTYTADARCGARPINPMWDKTCSSLYHMGTLNLACPALLLHPRSEKTVKLNQQVFFVTEHLSSSF